MVPVTRETEMLIELDYNRLLQWVVEHQHDLLTASTANFTAVQRQQLLSKSSERLAKRLSLAAGIKLVRKQNEEG